ncbi:hypothetical protein DSL92_08750 [Billgrantia gudaonensis]|uniref:Uncharacterized protein n=1 Tax=Billgrantia gudaonensis TaxID=376427 RepID=A0A3S0QFI2_9GAMM|nr:hypothetical protein DSL92_08750 [Halomonas gudaonensis]
MVQQSGRTLASAPVTVATGDVSLSIEGSPKTRRRRHGELAGARGATRPDSDSGSGRSGDAPAIHEARASQVAPAAIRARVLRRVRTTL